MVGEALQLPLPRIRTSSELQPAPPVNLRLQLSQGLGTQARRVNWLQSASFVF